MPYQSKLWCTFQNHDGMYCWVGLVLSKKSYPQISVVKSYPEELSIKRNWKLDSRIESGTEVTTTSSGVERDHPQQNWSSDLASVNCWKFGKHFDVARFVVYYWIFAIVNLALLNLPHLKIRLWNLEMRKF